MNDGPVHELVGSVDEGAGSSMQELLLRLYIQVFGSQKSEICQKGIPRVTAT